MRPFTRCRRLNGFTDKPGWKQKSNSFLKMLFDLPMRYLRREAFSYASLEFREEFGPGYVNVEVIYHLNVFIPKQYISKAIVFIPTSLMLRF